SQFAFTLRVMKAAAEWASAVNSGAIQNAKSIHRLTSKRSLRRFCEVDGCHRAGADGAFFGIRAGATAENLVFLWQEISVRIVSGKLCMRDSRNVFLGLL